MENCTEEMKIIDTSTFSFPKVIENDFLYVDKTEYVWKLVRRRGGAYFLSRPRRFGKSLFLSTLKAVFEGRRDLFRGLAMDKVDYDWQEYPVIHLDFCDAGLSNLREFRIYLWSTLDDISKQTGVPYTRSTIAKSFCDLIQGIASKGKKVVLLVDEYDKPILDNITSPHIQEILKLFKNFYGVIKRCEAYIRFAFITGVSKFSRVSLFSDLNNLVDLTLDPDFAGMLGFTEAEIREYYADDFPVAAKENNCSEEELMRRLLFWYDGYRFSKAEIHVCNPVSISRFFDMHYIFSCYWDETGTPRFLIDLAGKQDYDYEEELAKFHDERILSAYDYNHLDVTGMLWQTGYLTIKEVSTNFLGSLEYRLDFPDFEVHGSFCARLMEFYCKLSKGSGGILANGLYKAIQNDDLNGFMTQFQTFLAGIKYELHLPYEKYYQTIFFVVFRMLGISIDVESHTNEGSIDAYIRTEKKIYIFEFKLNKSPESAIGQILDRRYYEKFRNEGLPIVLVGANFDMSKGRLDSWGETTI